MRREDVHILNDHTVLHMSVYLQDVSIANKYEFSVNDIRQLGRLYTNIMPDKGLGFT